VFVFDLRNYEVAFAPPPPPRSPSPPPPRPPPLPPPQKPYPPYSPFPPPPPVPRSPPPVISDYDRVVRHVLPTPPPHPARRSDTKVKQQSPAHGRLLHAAAKSALRCPPISFSRIVARTEGYTCDAKVVWALVAPRSRAHDKPLLVRFAMFLFRTFSVHISTLPAARSLSISLRCRLQRDVRSGSPDDSQKHTYTVEWRPWKTVYVLVGVVMGLMITGCLTFRAVATHDSNPFWFCGFTLLVLAVAGVLCWQAAEQEMWMHQGTKAARAGLMVLLYSSGLGIGSALIGRGMFEVWRYVMSKAGRNFSRLTSRGPMNTPWCW
jgi:hypothetical protein